MNTPKTPAPTAPPERPNRDEWKGAVRYGAPPAPAPTKPPTIPTPAEARRLRDAHFAAKAAPIIAGVLGKIEGGVRFPVSGEPVAPEIAEAVERAFRAQGWFTKVEPRPGDLSTTSERRVYVSDVCLSCGGGGTVGNGPNESPCSDCAASRSTDQELGR